MENAGHLEVGVGIYQAMYEFTFHQNGDLDSFISFWKSELPRIGDTEAELPFEFKSFWGNELEMDVLQVLPLKASKDPELAIAKSERVALYEDVEPFLFRVFNKEEFVRQMLLFLGVHFPFVFHEMHRIYEIELETRDVDYNTEYLNLMDEVQLHPHLIRSVQRQAIVRAVLQAQGPLNDEWRIVLLLFEYQLQRHSNNDLNKVLELAHSMDCSCKWFRRIVRHLEFIVHKTARKKEIDCDYKSKFNRFREHMTLRYAREFLIAVMDSDLLDKVLDIFQQWYEKDSKNYSPECFYCWRMLLCLKNLPFPCKKSSLCQLLRQNKLEKAHRKFPHYVLAYPLCSFPASRILSKRNWIRCIQQAASIQQQQEMLLTMTQLELFCRQ